MAEAAPGRTAFGIGTSSDVIVERWNSTPFDEPYKKTATWSASSRPRSPGEGGRDYDTFTVKGFRLGRKVPEPPAILVAALRPGMLRLAGVEGDGAIINWLSSDDVKPRAQVGAGKEIVARIFVCPSTDAEPSAAWRSAVAAYLNVTVYAEFHEWLGRGDDLRRCGRRGRRATARRRPPPSPITSSTR